MILPFPLPDVTLREVSEVRRVNNPLFGDDYWQMNQNEFAMQVEKVGDFYVCNGTDVEYYPMPGVTEEEIQLYLNGSVFGAILHQRHILPMHGSSFAVNGTGVMLCGQSGSGKSALATSFSMNDCDFLTDDVTPVIFKDKQPNILALSDRIKLWEDTLEQLKLDKSGLKRISPETDKYYFKIDRRNSDPVPLRIIYILSINDQTETVITELSGSARFSSLFSEIYRVDFLNGMPDNEKIYFRNLVDISNNLKIYRVRRPVSIKVNDVMILLREHIYNSLSISGIEKVKSH